MTLRELIKLVLINACIVPGIALMLDAALWLSGFPVLPL